MHGNLYQITYNSYMANYYGVYLDSSFGTFCKSAFEME